MPFPLLYEINTRCWLRDLSITARRPISLADIPQAEFENWQRLGFTHIWLMGVWTTGARSRSRALEIPELRDAYGQALPAWSTEDVGSSPYAIADYKVNSSLGGPAELAHFRAKLNSAGIRLMLDFVPNHIGLDHPWVTQRPDLLVQMPAMAAGSFTQETGKGRIHLAYGKDPNSSAWTDTVQLDYRRPETHAAMLDALHGVAAQCDGVRCDMAMLLLNDVFAQTWKDSLPPQTAAQSEFWSEAIQSIKQRHPGFEFLAEVYWGVEERLERLGFDYTYDKTLYDDLLANNGPSVQKHLLGLTQERLGRGAHFLENHDECRVAEVLGFGEHRAAALTILSLPGLRFLHEGQLVGYRRRLPVQLLRRAVETPDPAISGMYEQLLATLRTSHIGRGTGELLEPRKAWGQNPTAQNFILAQWTNNSPSFDMVVVNLAPHQAQCYAPLKLPAGTAQNWLLTDLLSTERYVRPDDDLRKRGLYLDVVAHGCHVFRVEPTS